MVLSKAAACLLPDPGLLEIITVLFAFGVCENSRVVALRLPQRGRWRISKSLLADQVIDA
jgi:hypothetical protein